MNLRKLFLILGITGAALAFSPRASADLKDIKVSKEKKVEIAAPIAPSVAYGISANSNENLGCFYRQKFEAPWAITPFVTANLDKKSQGIDGLIRFENEKIGGGFRFGAGKKEWSYKNASLTNLNGIIENRLINQQTEKNNQAIGFEFGNLERALIQALYQPASTDDKITEKVNQKEITPYYEITTNVKTITDIQIKESDQSARANLVLANEDWYNIACNFTGSWLNVKEKGNIKTDVKTQVIVNGDTTYNESYRTTPIDRKIANEFYTITPTFELNKENENAYSRFEIPIGFGDYTNVALNGIFGKQWNSYIIDGRTETDFTNKKAGMKIGVYKSNGNGAFKALIDHYKAYDPQNILLTLERRAILDNLTYNHFAGTLQGFGCGIGINLRERQKPGYEIHALGSRNGCFGWISAATDNPKHAKRNYAISAAAGYGGFSIEACYSNSNGKESYGGKIVAYK